MLSFLNGNDMTNTEIILKLNWVDEAIVCIRKATVDDLLAMKVGKLFDYGSITHMEHNQYVANKCH